MAVVLSYYFLTLIIFNNILTLVTATVIIIFYLHYGGYFSLVFVCVCFSVNKSTQQLLNKSL